ncbi:serine/threonine-protein kinase PBS1 [Quercus suber]|uniref:serine/threonine-protein kinase PBS1 n=1 Tax=Quercus suber TaxID=58331 RepID=UPI0032DEC0C1
MEELADTTDNFSEKNLIGETLFTKLYRGTIGQDWLPFEDWVVTVKIWDYTLQSDKAGFLSSCYLNTNESLKEEVMFLTQPSAKQHPNVVNLLGYCNRRYLEAVVYDLNPLDIVHNLATTGSLTWLQRIKVALGFARALEFLHDPKKPYLDCNPKIFEFSTMSGGILDGPEEGGFEYRPNRYLVHESLVEDPGFYASDGIMITELAMRCIQRELDKRPTMKDVVKRLEGLQAVQLYGNVVGM